MHYTGTMRISDKGHLEIGGIDSVDLAKKFGTPLWVIDENGLRDNCRRVKNAFDSHGDALVIYASKTLSNMAILKIVASHGLGLDVVSGGEIYTAHKAGFPMEKVFFHGNNKSVEELILALTVNVGRIVIDNFYELNLLEEICEKLNIHGQEVYLRITPGVDAHTHDFVKTGLIDSKFGFTLTDGQALKGVKTALEKEHLILAGLHCHIGSQIFTLEPFQHTAAIMMKFLYDIKQDLGFEIRELDLGGGLGIYYFAGDEPSTYEKWAETIMNEVAKQALELGITKPKVIVEPGRSIAGPVGTTLYTVGSHKVVEGIRKYIAVDGGMADNPRPALYGSKYSAIIANKANQTADELVSVAGKCCESGDMLAWNVNLPQPEAGDILAVFATGAYNYSMSSNYNRLPRPAMVLVADGQADVIVARESYDDIIRNDRLPARLE